jgi:hypothetical protein
MRHSHLCEEEHQTQEGGIIVYKLVTVVDGRRTSLCMMGRCEATYFCDQVTVPPLPQSPLFAYRTLEGAQRQYLYLKKINNPALLIELWKARTSGELPGPDRIPQAGAYYSSLTRHAGYGAGLVGCYTFFWQNVSYCLKHCIGKRAGQKLDPAITVCCRDLILLEQQSMQEEGDACL